MKKNILILTAVAGLTIATVAVALRTTSHEPTVNRQAEIAWENYYNQSTIEGSTKATRLADK